MDTKILKFNEFEAVIERTNTNIIAPMKSIKCNDRNITINSIKQ